MPDMQENHQDLEPERAQLIADTLYRQQREAFEAVSEWGKRITNHNFITNGGGAVACLTYIGTGAGLPQIKIALVLFTLGVIAVGIELRAMFDAGSALTSDAGRRHRGFLNNELTVAETATIHANTEKAKAVNHCAGWVSQILFILGVIVGGIGFFVPQNPTVGM